MAVYGHYKAIVDTKELIKKLIKDGGRSVDDIVFFIGDQRGFSENWVKKYLKILENRGFFTINKEGFCQYGDGKGNNSPDKPGDLGENSEND